MEVPHLDEYATLAGVPLHFFFQSDFSCSTSLQCVSSTFIFYFLVLGEGGGWG